jgi:hypothetical protein
MRAALRRVLAYSTLAFKNTRFGKELAKPRLELSGTIERGDESFPAIRRKGEMALFSEDVFSSSAGAL